MPAPAVYSVVAAQQDGRRFGTTQWRRGGPLIDAVPSGGTSPPRR
jgi:hypothetical protein